eukprot:4448272-Pleurochrysis_carterae.AAC.1
MAEPARERANVLGGGAAGDGRAAAGCTGGKEGTRGGGRRQIYFTAAGRGLVDIGCKELGAPRDADSV